MCISFYLSVDNVRNPVDRRSNKNVSVDKDVEYNYFTKRY